MSKEVKSESLTKVNGGLRADVLIPVTSNGVWYFIITFKLNGVVNEQQRGPYNTESEANFAAEDLRLALVNQGATDVQIEIKKNEQDDKIAY